MRKGTPTHGAYQRSDVFQTVLDQGQRPVSDHVFDVVIKSVCACGRVGDVAGSELSVTARRQSWRRLWVITDRTPSQCKKTAGWQRAEESSHCRSSSQTAGRCRVHPVSEARGLWVGGERCERKVCDDAWSHVCDHDEADEETEDADGEKQDFTPMADVEEGRVQVWNRSGESFQTYKLKHRTM